VTKIFIRTDFYKI